MNAPNNRPSTQTGLVPRYEAAVSGSHEPKQPPAPLSLREMDEPHATTGVIQVVSEGTDASRDLGDLNEPE